MVIPISTGGVEASPATRRNTQILMTLVGKSANHAHGGSGFRLRRGFCD